MSDPLRNRLAEERAKLDQEFADFEREYHEKRRLIDDFERRVLGSENGSAKPLGSTTTRTDRPRSESAAGAPSAIGISQAVRKIMEDGRARTTAETTHLAKAMNVKAPRASRSQRPSRSRIYSLKRAGHLGIRREHAKIPGGAKERLNGSAG